MHTHTNTSEKMISNSNQIKNKPINSLAETEELIKGMGEESATQSSIPTGQDTSNGLQTERTRNDVPKTDFQKLGEQ